MRKLLIASALSATLPFSSMVMADPDVGCGLGTMLFEGHSGKVSKVLAATTNGTSGNQTFGITFGTLGCDGSGEVTSSAKVAMFIDGNMDNLARDIAKGEGETLATLSEVWGVQGDDKLAFHQLAQENFAEVFESDNVTSQQVFTNLNELLSQNESLAVYTI